MFVHALFILIFKYVVADMLPLPFFLHTGKREDLQSYNKSQPCNDFYQFACKRWMSETTRPSYEPIWGHWQAVSYQINSRLQKILERTDKNDKSLYKAQTFYKSCVGAEKSEKKYLNQLQKLVAYLNGWPLVQNKAKKIEDHEWLMDVIKVTKLLHISPILKLYSALDFKDTTKNILYVEKGNFILPHLILLNPRGHAFELRTYQNWILETAKHLYGKVGSDINRRVKKIVEFEINLARIGYTRGNKRVRTTIGRLNKLTPINWLHVFKNLATYPDSLNFNTTIAVDMGYLNRLLILIKKTNKEHIANYIIWNVIKDLSRESTLHLRHLSFLMDKAILGVTSDIPRAQECTNRVVKHLSFALIRPYVDLHVNQGTLQYVVNMTLNLKEEFVKMLNKTSWITTQTKAMAIDKVLAIKQLIGYPEWAMNKSLVNEFYQDLNITENHFTNMIELKHFTYQTEFANLDKTSELWWPSSPFEVNAYYSILQNVIIIPLGLIEPPFFDAHKNSMFNYGALGSLIGHEISHSLDTIGRHADKNGNFVSWWAPLDVIKYKTKAQCYVEKSKSSASLPEDIADDVGLKLSLRAYNNNKSNTTADLASIQQFFASYAQLWCELSTETKFVNDEEHSPVKMRVLKTLYNNNDFTGAFGCKQNRNVCELW